MSCIALHEQPTAPLHFLEGMNTFFILSAKYLFVLPLLILSIYFLSRSWSTQKKILIFAGSSLFFIYLVAQVAGYLYFDPRPFVLGHFIPLIQHAPDNGFPSDHALLVFALASIGAFLNLWLGIVLFAIALIVATARVYVGLHHVIDVIGSALISVVITSVVHLFLTYIQPKKVR